MKHVIGIMGTPVSSNNRGVLALATSLVNLCVSADGAIEPMLLLNHSKNQSVSIHVGEGLRSIRVVHSRLSLRAKMRDHLAWIVLASLLYRFISIPRLRRALAGGTPWIRALEEAKWIGDIHGGDSFSDIYGMRRFLLGFLIAWSVILVKGEIVQFPQTFGPYRRWPARRLARYVLSRSSVIIARDTYSRQLAQDLVGPKKEVWLSPDVAFALKPMIPPASIEFTPPCGGPLPRGVIGINVNGLIYNGGYTRANMFGLTIQYPDLLRELVRKLLSIHPGELWCIPHTYGKPGQVESDNHAAFMMRDGLPTAAQNRVRLVSAAYNQHEIKWIIGQCDFFIGSRMHSCIAALSQGIPCVGIAYSRKFAGVFATVKMENWVVDGRMVDNDAAVSRVMELYHARENEKAGLLLRAESTRSQLNEVFHRLVHRTS